MKFAQASAVQGKIVRKSGVYALVNEYFENDFNEVMCRMSRISFIFRGIQCDLWSGRKASVQP